MRLCSYINGGLLSDGSGANPNRFSDAVSASTSAGNSQTKRHQQNLYVGSVSSYSIVKLL